ncbi:MAG: DUF4430 domain-containing protein [Clostridiales bacterium]|nr:DUF4430 domain-containing protein [Clostridiales bacterium]
MKKKPVETLCLVLVSILIILTAAPGYSVTRAYAVSGQNIEHEITGIIRDELNANNAASVQDLIDGAYSENAGSTTDWFVFSFIQYAGAKYDYSNYAAALKKKGVSSSPTTKERYALNFAAMGTNTAYIKKIVDEEIDELGIMSDVFGLHLIANGYKSAKISEKELTKKIISLQHGDGGFALNSDAPSDVDITAMTVQCLAPYYHTDSSVKSAVDKALALLSSRQFEDGGYSSYYSDKNPESAAQVIVALTSLGINPLKDNRFIKSENSAVDFMLKFRATDNGYTHKQGGAYNVSATSQVLYSLVSIYRLENGMGRLYELNSGVKTIIPTDSLSTAKETAKSTSSPSNNAAFYSPASTSPASLTAFSSKKEEKNIEATVSSTRSDSSAVRTSSNKVKTTLESFYHNKTGNSGSLSKTQPYTAVSSRELLTNQIALYNGAETVTDLNNYTHSDAVSSSLSNNRINNVKDETNSKPDIYSEEDFGKIENTEPITSEYIRQQSNKMFSAKAVAVISVWIIAFALCAVLVIKKKTKKINFIIILLTAGVIAILLAFSSVQLPDDYYSSEQLTVTDTICVTMSIDCKTVAGKGDEKITPKDGIILPDTHFTLPVGASAYDCLIVASKEYHIQIEDSSKTLSDHSAAYIAGINYLYEFDYGNLSGWMFSVNGEFGDSGCGEYKLSDGDYIQWRYTENIGEDLK